MKAGVFNVLITVIFVGLAIWAAVSLYSRYIENPWTRDGQVRANIVGTAPRVSGPIIQVTVRDNQPERKGDLLFEIDPSDFQAQVDIAGARAQLASAISPTIDWVRLPQRFPVRIEILGSSPVPLRIGQTVSVMMTASFSPTGSNEIANSR